MTEMNASLQSPISASWGQMQFSAVLVWSPVDRQNILNRVSRQTIHQTEHKRKRFISRMTTSYFYSILTAKVRTHGVFHDLF